MQIAGGLEGAIAGQTSPMSVARDISVSLAKRVVVAKVNDQLWDLNRPLEEDCSLALLTFNDEEGYVSLAFLAT